MKAIRIIQNPVLLILSFLFIIISGEHWGGFYLLYILLSLPHGSIHAILGIAGIILLTTAYLKYKQGKIISPARAVINISGLLLLILSLFLFFFNDKQGYNSGTFYQLVPLVSLCIFLLITISFVVYNIIGVTDKKT
jgi:hypothetical protein